MNLIIHLCRKDFSFAKHALWGAWAMFLLAALMPAFLTGALVDAAGAILGLLYVVPLFLIFSTTLRILSADTLTGGNAFISTRPVTMTKLWFSKLVAITALLLLPWLLAQVIGVWMLRVHLTPADWILFLAEKTLLFGLPASIALIVGTHTRHFVWGTMLFIAFNALLLWLAVTIFNRPGGLNFITEARLLKASQWLVAQSLIPIAAILLAWLWMARRRISWSIGAGGIALAAIAIVSTQWQVNFVKPLAISEVDRIPTAHDLRIAWLGDSHISSSSRNRVSLTSVTREAKVAGTPTGWLANPSGVRADARFRDGSMIAAQATHSRHTGDYSRAMLPSLVVEVPLKHPRSLNLGHWATWFETPTSLLRDRTDTTCTISGECMVELDQPVVLANLPAQSGASASRGRFRYRIEQVAASGAEISVKFTVSGVDLTSRADPMNKHVEIEILLINPKTREYTALGLGSSSSQNVPGWMTRTHSLRIDDWPDKQTSDPQIFLKDARIYLIGRRHGGTVRVPFEMRDIELKPDR